MTSTRVFWIFGIVVVVAFAINKRFQVCSPDELSALFTGLGFVGVIAAFRSDRERMNDDAKEHRELLREMRAQVKATCHAARVSALTGCLDHCRTELDKFRGVGVVAEGTQRRRDELQTRVRSLERQLSSASEITELF